MNNRAERRQRRLEKRLGAAVGVRTGATGSGRPGSTKVVRGGVSGKVRGHGLQFAELDKLKTGGKSYDVSEGEGDDGADAVEEEEIRKVDLDTSKMDCARWKAIADGRNKVIEDLENKLFESETAAAKYQNLCTERLAKINHLDSETSSLQREVWHLKEERSMRRATSSVRDREYYQQVAEVQALKQKNQQLKDVVDKFITNCRGNLEQCFLQAKIAMQDCEPVVAHRKGDSSARKVFDSPGSLDGDNSDYKVGEEPKQDFGANGVDDISGDTKDTGTNEDARIPDLWPRDESPHDAINFKSPIEEWDRGLLSHAERSQSLDMVGRHFLFWLHNHVRRPNAVEMASHKSQVQHGEIAECWAGITSEFLLHRYERETRMKSPTNQALTTLLRTVLNITASRMRSGGMKWCLIWVKCSHTLPGAVTANDKASEPKRPRVSEMDEHVNIDG